MKQSTQISESLKLAIFLCLAGGFQDAYSYNCRGHVFANAQTGNIVLLGQNLATGNWQLALRYIFPLMAFIGGVYVTEWIGYLYKDFKKLHWRQIVLLIEIPLLLIAGAMPQELNIPANVLMSFACAMQVNAFRKFSGIACATTMCIGNMRSGTEYLCKYHITKDRDMLRKSCQYYFIILVFAVGAAIGAVVTGWLGDRAIWIAAALLGVGFMMMFIKEDIEDNPELEREVSEIKDEAQKLETGLKKDVEEEAKELRRQAGKEKEDVKP